MFLFSFQFTYFLLILCFSDEGTEVLSQLSPVDEDAKIHPVSALGSIDESPLESINDKRAGLIRAIQKMSTQTEMIKTLVLKCRTHRSLDYAVELLKRVKLWLCSFCYWYWDSNYSTLHEDCMKYHFRFLGQKYREIRQAEIRDLHSDIQVMCSKIKDYAKVAMDTKSLNLIIRMSQGVLKDYDKYLCELWANMYP